MPPEIGPWAIMSLCSSGSTPRMTPTASPTGGSLFCATAPDARPKARATEAVSCRRLLAFISFRPLSSAGLNLTALFGAFLAGVAASFAFCNLGKLVALLFAIVANFLDGLCERVRVWRIDRGERGKRATRGDELHDCKLNSPVPIPLPRSDDRALFASCGVMSPRMPCRRPKFETDFEKPFFPVGSGNQPALTHERSLGRVDRTLLSSRSGCACSAKRFHRLFKSRSAVSSLLNPQLALCLIPLAPERASPSSDQRKIANPIGDVRQSLLSCLVRLHQSGGAGLPLAGDGPAGSGVNVIKATKRSLIRAVKGQAA